MTSRSPWPPPLPPISAALRDRLVKIGAKIVRHVRSVTFQMTEVMVSRGLFQHMLDAIAALRPLPPARC